MMANVCRGGSASLASCGPPRELWQKGTWHSEGALCTNNLLPRARPMPRCMGTLVLEFVLLQQDPHTKVPGQQKGVLVSQDAAYLPLSSSFPYCRT